MGGLGNRNVHIWGSFKKIKFKTLYLVITVPEKHKYSRYYILVLHTFLIGHSCKNHQITSKNKTVLTLESRYSNLNFNTASVALS